MSIMQYRQENGQFTSVMQFTRLAGMGYVLASRLIGRVRMSVRGGADNSIMYYVAHVSDVHVSTVNVVDMATGYIMLDTGCRRSVAGPKWHSAMRTRLQSLGLEPIEKPCKSQFVFGSGASVKAKSRWVYPIAIKGKPGLIDVAEVPCDCPGLLSKSSMQKMGMSYDMTNETVDIRTLNLKSVPVKSTNTGHPIINIGEFDTVQSDDYPQVFLVTSRGKKVASFPAETAEKQKFRRNKLPPVPADQYDSGPCLVEHGDWDEYHERFPEEPGEFTHPVETVKSPELPVTPEVPLNTLIQESPNENPVDSDNDESLDDEAVDEQDVRRTITKGVLRRLRNTLAVLTSLVKNPKPAKLKVLEICTWTANVTKTAVRRGWDEVSPVTLESGYDLTTPTGRKMAMEVLEKHRPNLVVFAWPCTVWSSLQYINNKTAEYAENLQAQRKRQMSLLQFVLWVFLWCVQHGSVFVGENPQSSLAWQTEPLRKLLSHEKTLVTDFPQCAFGLQDPQSREPMRKNTRVVTNSTSLAQALQRSCNHDSHQRIEGSTRVWSDDTCKYVTMKRSEYAGGYTTKLGNAIVKSVGAHFEVCVTRTPLTLTVTWPPSSKDRIDGHRLARTALGYRRHQFALTCNVPMMRQGHLHGTPSSVVVPSTTKQARSLLTTASRTYFNTDGMNYFPVPQHFKPSFTTIPPKHKKTGVPQPPTQPLTPQSRSANQLSAQPVGPIKVPPGATRRSRCLANPRPPPAAAKYFTFPQ